MLDRANQNVVPFAKSSNAIVSAKIQVLNRFAEARGEMPDCLNAQSHSVRRVSDRQPAPFYRLAANKRGNHLRKLRVLG
jgi:hypothetical protein